MPESKYDLILKQRQQKPVSEEKFSFEDLCSKIKEAFFNDWENRESSGVTLDLQKKAIIGYEKEKNYFLDRIGTLIAEFDAFNVEYPKWYESLSDAIYHEVWGLAGLAQWFSIEYQGSSSAKIIADSIYFMKDGRMVKMPQKISYRRKEQLIKAFMLLTPEERMDKPYYELYMLDGTRITIFVEPMAKKGQSSIVFRRYIIPRFSFEEQASRGTIPSQIIPMLKAMVEIGYNVVFMGAVRTAKTTFLTTWQSYENPSLEGVMVETDPEIPLDRILPGAPILQLIADGENLKAISKNLLRSDADYFIMAEARDGIALDTAVRIASKGTKRMKLTFHSRNPYNFPLEAATEIVKSTGGDIQLSMKQIASNFDYIFHFIQLKDKNCKRLKGIYEMSLGPDGDILINEILSYNAIADKWKVKYKISGDKKHYALESDATSYEIFRSEMEKLSEFGTIS